MKRSRFIILCSGLLVFLYIIFADTTDESILRKEFDVPRGAKVVYYKAHPDESAWIRESLSIDIIFQLSEADFKQYFQSAQNSQNWQQLPIPEGFLKRMGRINSRLEYYAAHYEESREGSSQEGSSQYPSERELYQKFVRSLSLKAKSGLFQCKTAGNDIMNEPKRIIQAEPESDLRDFMLAVLDTDRKRLRIQVRTPY